MGNLEVFLKLLMDFSTEVEDRAHFPWNNDWRLVVGNLSLGLGVNSNKIKVLPHLLHELIEVPLVLGGDWHVVRHLADDVELLDSDGVDLVHHVEAWDVNTISFDDINELLHGVIGLESDLAVGDSVLVEDRPDGVIGHLGHLKSHALDDGDATLIFSLEVNVWLLLVQSDSETFQFFLDDFPVRDRLHDVKHDQNESAGSSDTNNLLTATFTVFGSLDDTWEIEELNFRTLVVEHTWNAGERCELVVGGLGVLAGQLSK